MKLPGNSSSWVFIFNHWPRAQRAFQAWEGFLFSCDPEARTATWHSSRGPHSHGAPCCVSAGTITTHEGQNGTPWSCATQRPHMGPQPRPTPLILPLTITQSHICQLLSLQALYPREHSIIIQVLRGCCNIDFHGNRILQPTRCTWSPHTSQKIPAWQGP